MRTFLYVCTFLHYLYVGIVIGVVILAFRYVRKKANEIRRKYDS